MDNHNMLQRNNLPMIKVAMKKRKTGFSFRRGVFPPIFSVILSSACRLRTITATE
jgi:hypothetical protein